MSYPIFGTVSESCWDTTLQTLMPFHNKCWLHRLLQFTTSLIVPNIFNVATTSASTMLGELETSSCFCLDSAFEATTQTCSIKVKSSNENGIQLLIFANKVYLATRMHPAIHTEGSEIPESI